MKNKYKPIFKKYQPKNQIKRPRLNNQINALEIRVIDETGQNLGLMKTSEALKIAIEKELDLIEISPTAQPPVCKIMDFGKYLYQQEKQAKASKAKIKTIEVRGVRFGLKTSKHDMELKAGKIAEFLSDGDKVRLEMVLRGREKSLKDFARVKFSDFLKLIPIEYAIEQDIKFGPMGISMVIGKK